MRIISMLSGGLLFAAVTAAAAAPRPSCDLIDSAISANEDFAELALANDVAAARQALRVIHEEFAKIKPALPADAALKAEAQIQAADAAMAAGDLARAAAAAIEVYRTLIVALKRRLPTTLDVAMLDYSGFRLHALLASVPVNWDAITAAVEESAVNTKSAQRRLNDKGLSDLAGGVQAGLDAAAIAKGRGWLGSVAQIQLDSVDLLERKIKNPAPGACP